MRRSIAILILLLCGFQISCNTYFPLKFSPNSNQQNYYVKKSEAQKVALKLYRITKGHQILRSNHSNGQIRDHLIASYHSFPGGNNLTALHIFNFAEGGFVILSADKRTQAVLAFSEGNSFGFKGGLPTGISLWVGEMISLVEATRKEDLPLQKTYEAEIDQFIELFGRKRPPDTLKTLWAQQMGFNNFMPKLDYCGTSSYPALPPENKGRAYTGCVATAMAQIMRYYEYPKKYDYSIMPEVVNTANVVSKGTNEAALLIFDISSSLPVDPECEATGAAANIVDIVKTFKNNFNYSPTVDHRVFDFQTAKHEIANGRPVILTGFWSQSNWLPGKGHAWVADGCFDTADQEKRNGNGSIALLHMNWGWGNSGYNGWYYSETWAPGSYNHQYRKEMVVGIQP